jgi:2-keto-4-pentenoate hydratase/2-oxohepta-3-ene-1,7-dioic acid hydratase in catechol pathway
MRFAAWTEDSGASRVGLLEGETLHARGNGCLMELWNRRGSREDPPPLRIGDVVSMTVQGICTIRNRVVAGADPAARRASGVRA